MDPLLVHELITRVRQDHWILNRLITCCSVLFLRMCRRKERPPTLNKVIPRRQLSVMFPGSRVLLEANVIFVAPCCK